MPLDYVVSTFVTLLIVVDPAGLVPAYLAITEGIPRHVRRQIAIRGCCFAAAILAGTALFGDWLLTRLSISLPAFRIAGGLLLFSIASEMVLGVRTERQSKAAEQAVEEHWRNLAAFPLAIPLMAGPGAITATILLAGRTEGRPVLLGLLIGVIVVVIAICFAAFLFAGRVARLFGSTGNMVLSRLLGVILAALAVQYVVDAVRAVIAG
jgi:multiple antibiotic resistance protein